MTKRIFIGLILILASFSGAAQYVVKDGTELLNLQKLPQEKAYVDHTGPLIFSGEYLYYALTCFSAQTNKLTDISKIGYVVLVNEAKEKVFEHKLKLEKGMAQGDFFVATDIPSGKYKLLAYTQWMKNGGLAQVFQDDILIVNPYLADQSSLLPMAPTDAEDLPVAMNEASTSAVMDSATVSVNLDKNTYAPREKVTLSIKNYKGPLGVGTYSIKVRKKNEIPSMPAVSAIAYATSHLNVDKQLKQAVGDSLYLPEQRGELFFGSVVDSLTKAPIKDVPVILSIPGEEFILKFSQTDQDGNFYTYLRKDYKNALAVIQVEDKNQAYEITKGVVSDLDLSGLTFSDFRLSKEHANYIRERSILNQIENQFFAKKPDSVLQGTPIDPFDGGLPEVFYLDEYTRFPTFAETLVEVVKFAGYRVGGAAPDYVKISQDFKTFNEEYNDFPAIVLIDGVFIPNHEEIKTFDARSIERIRIIRDQFVLGGKQYQGMMSVETFDGDYVETFNATNALVVEFDAPLAKKNYYKQDYSSADNPFSRIPDYRRLLFWEPHLQVAGSSYNFEFFTSDIEGEYEVMLNGFTSYGKPITLSKTIYVSN